MSLSQKIKKECKYIENNSKKSLNSFINLYVSNVCHINEYDSIRKYGEIGEYGCKIDNSQLLYSNNRYTVGNYFPELYDETASEYLQCAARGGDQLVLFQFLKNTFGNIDEEGNLCLPNIYEISYRKLKINSCLGQNEYSYALWEKSNNFEYWWQSFLINLDGFNPKNVKSVEDIPKACSSRKQLAGWSPCGIPEIWYLRYKYLKNKGAPESDSNLITAKLLFEYGVGLSIKDFEAELQNKVDN